MNTDALQRTLDAIDAVTTCGWCGTTLTATAPSSDYCTELHQELWLARHVKAHDVEATPNAGRLIINGHNAPIVHGSLRFFVDEIVSLGARFGEAVAFPRLADLRAEHAQRQDLEQHRRRTLEGDWMFTDLTPIGQVFAQLGEFIPGFLDGVRAATSQGGKPPTDPRARALWLRKNPNTGPKPRKQRPPKHLKR